MMKAVKFSKKELLQHGRLTIALLVLWSGTRIQQHRVSFFLSVSNPDSLIKTMSEIFF